MLVKMNICSFLLNSVQQSSISEMAVTSVTEIRVYLNRMLLS